MVAVSEDYPTWKTHKNPAIWTWRIIEGPPVVHWFYHINKAKRFATQLLSDVTLRLMWLPNFGQTIICQKVRGSPLPLLLSSTSKQYLFPKKNTLFLKAPVYWRPKNHFVACSCNPFYSSTDPGLYSHNVPTLETDSFKGIACDSLQIFYTRLCGSRSILLLTIKENYLWTSPSVLQSYPKNTVHRTWTLTRFAVVLTSFLSVKSWE